MTTLRSSRQALLLASVFGALVLSTLTGCGDGGDGSDGSGGTGTGGTAVGTGGDTSTGGMATTGGDTGSGGTSTGGDTSDLDLGSGTITLEVDGTPTTIDVWQVTEYDVDEFLVNGNGQDPDLVYALSLFIIPGVGTSDCTDSSQSEVSYQGKDSEGDTTTFSSAGSSSCTLTVTEYGAVGEPVRGTFSGEVKAYGTEVATMTNGSFDLVRGSDR